MKFEEWKSEYEHEFGLLDEQQEAAAFDAFGHANRSDPKESEFRGFRIRDRQGWYDFCMEKGTSGDQVFDILKDWELVEDYYRKQALEEAASIPVKYCRCGIEEEPCDFCEVAKQISELAEG